MSMSLVKRIWNAIRNPVRYVGRDLQGNTYFESRSYNDPSRTKRTVQYHYPDDMWKYIGNGKRLPVQWSAWLTHTRTHPPTIQELEADLNRQRRVLANAEMIAARDKAEAEEMERTRQHDAHIAVEDALSNTRGERTRSESNEPPAPTSEAQQSPLHTFSKVLPPKFVTPATQRISGSSKPFMISPQPPAAEFETKKSSRDERDSAGPQSQPRNTSPWKTASMETESWAPKTRRRS